MCEWSKHAQRIVGEYMSEKYYVIVRCDDKDCEYRKQEQAKYGKSNADFWESLE